MKPKICIVSYPKSGRTWLRVLIGKALCEQYGLCEQLILDEEKLAEAAGLAPMVYTHDGSSNREGRHYKDLEAEKTQFKNNKVLFLIRDPRDVVVSCYFQASKRRNLYRDSISDFIRDDHYGIQKILTFYSTWYANSQIPKEFLLLRYEEMHANPGKSLRLSLNFIGVHEIDDRIISRAVDYASFDNLRKIEREGHFRSKKLRPGDVEDEESYKVRRGKVGGYVDYLSREDCQYVNGVIQELGCAFYGWSRLS